MGTKFSKKNKSSKIKLPLSAEECEVDFSKYKGWKMTDKHINVLKNVLLEYQLTNDILKVLLLFIPEIKPKDFVFKIVVDGNGGVGKSCLVIRHITGNFLDEYDPTIEDSYRTSTPVYGKDTNIILDILDTAGREEFAALRDVWFRESEVIILCESCSSSHIIPNEIKYRIDRYNRMLTDENDQKPVIFVVTKCDLDDYKTYKEKRRNEILKYCQELKIPYIETSAKKNVNTEYLWKIVYLEWKYMTTVPTEKRNITKIFYDNPKM